MHSSNLNYSSTTWVRAFQLLSAGALVIAANCAIAEPPSPVGFWQFPEDKTVIELYACNQSQVCGRIVAPPPKTKDDPADWDPQTLCAVQILGDLKRDKDRWVKGWVVDPDSGEKYKATLSPLDDGRMKLRAYTILESLNESFVLVRAMPEAATCPTKGAQ